MADKEATVFVIDISEFMASKESYYPGTALDWCMEYVWDKLGIKILAARKTDYVAVLAVGSVETDHNMGDEEAYRHIRVILPFPRRNGDDLKAYTFSKSHVDVMMSELHPSKMTEGDLLSGVILGVQMLTEFCLKLKFKKNLIVLTKGELLTDFTDAEAVGNQIQSENIAFSVLGVGFDDPDYCFKEESKSEIKTMNETNFRKMCDETDGIFATYAEVAESILAPRIRPVRPVTTFRGTLTIGDPTTFANTVEIKVERYPKTKQAKTISASKFSTAAETHAVIAHASQRNGQQTNDGPDITHQVAPARVYKLQDGEELADSSQLEKGYAYGRTVVPISQADEDFLKYPTTVGLSVLGFIDNSSFVRYMGMGETSLIVSQKADNQAALALSSLIHALYENDSYAVARLVRKDNVPPAMVLLAPNIEPDFESLLELPLPFSEDVRQYKFAPLDRIKASNGEMLQQHRYLPSSKLSCAMDDYLDSLDIDQLGDANGIATDALRPEETYSFGVHRVMQAIMFRAFHHPSAPIPPPRDVLVRNSRIPESVLRQAQVKLDVVAQVADTKKVPPRTANKRKRGEQDEPVKTGLDLDALLGGTNAEDSGNEGHHNKRSITASIGQANPAVDFETMMKDDSLIDAAFQQIQPVLIEMVQYSLGNQTYATTVDALTVFRKHAIEQEESELFNLFLERFEKKMAEENRGDFLQLMQDKAIGAIDDAELAG